MVNEKQEIINTVNTLPDNVTWDDALYTLYLHSKLAKSKENIKKGNTITLPELKAHIEELKDKYATNNI